MSKHTLGPWVADDNEGFSMWKIYSRMSPSGSGIQGPCVAEVMGDSAEADANANLIAAAPELLDALNEAPVPSKYHVARGFEANRFLADYEAWMEKCRDAIAKAEGKVMP